ncbi:hypothetical protein GGS20DRAFT_595983 [Poronia punctata]|nr:hypothetical protein GGS20DRAFT_595983 [Poronia punctata]
MRESSSERHGRNGPPLDTDKAIAIIGMGCKFPGADSVEEFWHLLESGRSMASEPPPERFPTHTHKRSNDKSIFSGNFLNNVSDFDNRFFKVSSREAATMDPQQRLLLEVAYQALESAAFFRPQQNEPDTEVGCFVGLIGSDYNDNVASHPPNAFSALSTLRAFLTGRISHFFGFTGPSITYDTACSSSAVAIDAACKAILQGDCTSAIAGGVSVFTSPHLYQNLAQASFLSQTGPTKPFDQGADGYCRGEGVGLVVLKKLSKAVEDGDNILGTILSTAVKQSSNKVPITVPHSGSHASLYRKVLDLAGVAPEEVSYLEAHGSGTPVGDPREIDAIKDVFCGPRRQTPLYISSVKGNIGHAEGASGVAGLIKVLLMLQHKAIPRQVGFHKLNPKIEMDAAQWRIPTTTTPWPGENRLACVNNYGAAGSIAALLVGEAGFLPSTRPTTGKLLSAYPLVLTGNSPQSLADNCKKLRLHVKASPSLTLADIAYGLSERQNRKLPQKLVATASDLAELDRVLAAPAPALDAPSSTRPVVLVFGGQGSRSVGLSRSVYDGSTLLQRHLQECDTIVKGWGQPGIFPGIFSTAPQEDVALLHTAQFSLQYACARSWIECGLKVDRLVGHSFGQLVALTVSGVLSLHDGLRLVYGRAMLMKTAWASENGSMLAVSSDLSTTLGLMSSVKRINPASRLEIACYNGPNSHVLVGSAAEVDMAVGILKGNPATRYKVLDVTHGFHSRLCEPILPGLERLAQSLQYRSPKIPLEMTTEFETTPSAQMIVNHTRDAVFFNDAIKRIDELHGPCTWVEAGSLTSVTDIVRRCVSDDPRHALYSVKLTRHDGLNSLAAVTANLWKEGHHVQFWPFHRSDRQIYQASNLPPYQFERISHWLDFKYDIPADSESSLVPATEKLVEPVLLSFSGLQTVSPACHRAIFVVDPRSEEWRTLVEGHAVLQQPLCPASLYVELVYQAGRHISAAKDMPLGVRGRLGDLKIISSVGLADDKSVKLVFRQLDQAGLRWEFAFSSELRDQSKNLEEPTVHATGEFEIVAQHDTSLDVEMSRIDRLLKYQRTDEVTLDRSAEAMHGSVIYNVFSKVVSYQDFYRGVRHIAADDNTVVGQVALPDPQPPRLKGFFTHPVAIDNFFQIASIYQNCLAPCPPDEIYVCTQVDSIIVDPGREEQGRGCGEWKVWTTTSSVGDKEVHADIFARDANTSRLVFVAFGARFNRIRTSSLAKVLFESNHTTPNSTALYPEDTPARLTTATPQVHAPKPSRVTKQSVNNGRPSPSPTPVPTVDPVDNRGDSGIEEEVRKLLSRVTDVPSECFAEDVTLADLGIDSLMVNEVVSEVNAQFGISIPSDQLVGLQDAPSFCRYITSQFNLQKPESLTKQVVPASTPNLPKLLSTGIVDESVVGQASQVVYARPQEHSDILSRLASLLASHLECPASDFDRSTNLAERGLDSLLCMEVVSDIRKEFGVYVDLSLLTMDSTYGHLTDIVLDAVSPGLATYSDSPPTSATSMSPLLTPVAETTDIDVHGGLLHRDSTSGNALKLFESIKSEFDKLASSHRFSNYYADVFERESRLVLAYTVEAFADMGVHLANLNPGDEISLLPTLPRHDRLRDSLYEILQQGKVADRDGSRYRRSEVPVDGTPSGVLLEELLRNAPQFAHDHRLLHLCGSNLADLMTGSKDPVNHLFGTKANRDILEKFYSTSPSYMTTSQLLTNFLVKFLSNSTPKPPGKKFRILEIGGGTGATTKWVVEGLATLGIPVEYTFTDISAALVAGGKRKFSRFDCMKYTTLNIENEPPLELHGQFDVVISTNCIHATRDLNNSLKNIGKLLQPNGFVSVVEFTERLYWFDLVFGLLDGWWMFNDGRPYVLASPEYWGDCMQNVGFKHVSWTGGSSHESDLIRIITGFKEAVEDSDIGRL